MDPSTTISLAALGSEFLKEGIKFLGKQAEIIVNRYNERKYKEKDKAKEQAEAKEQEKLAVVETSEAPDFLQLPPALTIDFDRAKEKKARLIVLSEALTPYITGDRQPDASDDELKSTMITLQQLIEYVYRRPLQIKEEVRRNIVEAVRGGKVELDENIQHIKEAGGNVIRAEDAGSTVIIGKSEQKIERNR
jgi:hypothetical protein